MPILVLDFSFTAMERQKGGKKLKKPGIKKWCQALIFWLKHLPK